VRTHHPTGPDGREGCTGYGTTDRLPYVLPFPPGVAYTVIQANRSGYGHSAFWKYSWDFGTPMGSIVTAARAGPIGQERRRTPGGAG
jgi:hypothetical protein